MHCIKFLLLAIVAAVVGCAQNVPRAAVRSATFEARNEYKIKVPEGVKRLRAWLALPQEDSNQQVASLKIESPVPYRIEKDSEGNRLAYIEADSPAAGDISVVETFLLHRSEATSTTDAARARPLTEGDRRELARYLKSNQNIVIDERIQKLADDIVGTETNPVIAARKIYDWVLGNIDYWVKDPKTKKASPVGSSVYCLDTRTGNCTDFHSLWAALARARGIPTRIIYGSFFKAELDGQDVDGSYHCWPEFYAPGIGWIPHDVAVADIFAGPFPVDAQNETLVRRTTADGYRGPDPAKVEYYFGNLDERRVVWSSGRDLTLTPPQEAGPVNALPKAYVEIDGRVHPETAGWTRKFTYRQVRA